MDRILTMPKPVYNVPVRVGGEVNMWTLEEPWMLPSTTKVFLIPLSAARIRNTLDEVRARVLPSSGGLMRFLYPRRNALSDEVLGWETWFDGKFVPLSRAAAGQRILVWVDRGTPRPMCGSLPGHHVTHTITKFDRGAGDRESYYIDYECFDSPRSPAVEGVHFELHRNVSPTCPECNVAQWRLFHVSAHLVPHVEAAKATKLAKVAAEKERRFFNRPTRFDRVIDEVPVKLKTSPPIPEVDDEPVGRDAKLQSRAKHEAVAKEKREQFKRERRWK